MRVNLKLGLGLGVGVGVGTCNHRFSQTLIETYLKVFGRIEGMGFFVRQPPQGLITFAS